MDFKQIRYFVSVAEAGSFSVGARRAFVTQPTLSAAIAALEAELGFALLERYARGVRLTPRGEEVLETARSILRKADQLKAASGGKPPGQAAAAWNSADDFAGLRGPMHCAVAGDRAGTVLAQ